ncbi:MAG: endonuclease/exonuclease/phosphatase family protein [Neorhizobium sp.]|nr:endonuclease/exonuclease/phosphatase family protein [Neorhizobium sp.]
MSADPSSHVAEPARTARRIRILTYNVHSCIGTDRRLDPARIADVIAAAKPDIIGLQELDVGRGRTGGVDQAHEIARHLGMDFHFHAALNVAEERYGDAILTALPMRLVKADTIPSVGEQRGALWVEVECDGARLQVINTHLGLPGRDRLAQAKTLVGKQWLGHGDCRDTPHVLIGDFNSTPVTRPYRLIARHMKDVRIEAGVKAKATFPSRFPLLRLDHVFVSQQVPVLGAGVLATPLSRRASDHLPFYAEIAI